MFKLAFGSLESRLVIHYRNFRVHNWRAYAGMAALGLVQNLGSLALQNNISEVLKFIITVAFYLAFSFSINNCFDANCDALQKEKLVNNPVARGSISFKESLILSLCMAVAGLLLAYLWFRSCFLPYFSLVLLAGTYSAPPLRLKSIPLVDLISHGLFFGALLYFYGHIVASGNLSYEAILIGMLIFIYSATLELRNHIEDIQTDLSSGTRTTACWLGYEKSRRLLEALLLLHWLLLMAVSINVRPHIGILFIAAIMLMSIRWIEPNRYLRLADLCTCVTLILLSVDSRILVLMGVTI